MTAKLTNDQHVKNRLNEIDVATAYRMSGLFESDAQVREYFTVERLEYHMGFDARFNAETLREWADFVIAHRDHMTTHATYTVRRGPKRLVRCSGTYREIDDSAAERAAERAENALHQRKSSLEAFGFNGGEPCKFDGVARAELVLWLDRLEIGKSIWLGEIEVTRTA